MSARSPWFGGSFELAAVEVRFGQTPALEGVSLAIRPGEALAIIGPSGSGKTTLLRLLNGALRCSAGQVAFNRRDLAELEPAELRRARAQIGFVHQDLALVPNLRVFQNVVAGRAGQESFGASLRSLVLPSRATQE